MPCLRGVTSLRDGWLEKDEDEDIAVFVVWSSQAGGAARHVPSAAKLLPDARARHFWDGGRFVGQGYRVLELDGKTFDLGEEAWDMWLLFDREARWASEGPPRPAWWEHQLDGAPPERQLDPQRFAGKAAELLR